MALLPLVPSFQVASLSSASHITAKDALRVALALAQWRSPGTTPDAAQQHSNEVGQWVLRAIAAHNSASGTAGREVGGARIEGGGAATGVQGPSAGERENVREGESSAAQAQQGGEAADAAAKQEQEEREKRAAVEREQRRRREGGGRAAANEFSRSLPVSQVRVLASAMAVSAGQRGNPVPPYVLTALQERAGFV